MRESPKLFRPKYPKAEFANAPVSSEPQFSDEFQPLRERVIAWLKLNVPETRLRHILRVERMSIELAIRHHLDPEKAAIAGLMHDLAKFFKPDRLLQMARDEGLELDPIDELNPHLLHADIGAVVARDEFGIHDLDILDAIRNHTLGRPQMSLLSCVVYLADGLEPGRGNTPELEELRRLSRQDLIEATWKSADSSVKHLIHARHLIHPRTVHTRNWFLQTATQRPRKSSYP
ncbi:bis(5'-nucleosyl)-tetraphosphatase (symmetrical) YqeK [Myxacorys almedinensis]|uniref:bis(5'-nucleosyl)-tetraphosphatase (symmetrical) n=1 Tax=Myxacorys almedinensis A TaxID=2690445 RepID=A0A8J7Z6R7_9CYAN|nr:bis(5'-nucleosyl)-tetraphosphatase (symmetrical) YqeK [Myxacorys almedinensis]NDJ16515.1 HD domain-containing protein [Myxacorys almedinensis A]